MKWTMNKNYKKPTCEYVSLHEFKNFKMIKKITRRDTRKSQIEKGTKNGFLRLDDPKNTKLTTNPHFPKSKL